MPAIVLFLILAIVERVGGRGKSKPSFEELYRELYGPVVGFLSKKRLPHDQAEELAQQTFLNAYKKYDDFQGNSKPSTWIFAIANNLFINHLRDRDAAKRKAEEVPIDAAHHEIPSGEPDAAARVNEDEGRRLLREAIEKLSPKMQQCVWSRVYEDRSYRDIAERLGVSESTAKTHFSLAGKQLRSVLVELYPELESILDLGKERHDDE